MLQMSELGQVSNKRDFLLDLAIYRTIQQAKFPIVKKRPHQPSRPQKQGKQTDKKRCHASLADTDS